MKIYEIINENKPFTYRGWDDNRSEKFPVKNTQRGVITIARSFDETDTLDRIMYNYYDIDLIGTTEVPVVGIRLERNQRVKQFIYGIDGKEGIVKDIGQINEFPNLYKYFMQLVVNAINTKHYLGENMNIETLTLESFIKDNPELAQALQQAEKEYRDAWDDKKSSLQQESKIIDSK